MKKLFFLLALTVLGTTAKSQTYSQLYYNPELHNWVTWNHNTRWAAEEQMRKSYAVQADVYEKARDKLVQVVAIKNHIYDHLKNVNAGLKQAKAIKYVYSDFEDLINKMGEMLELTVKHPQYAVLINRYYAKIYEHALLAYNGISDQVLREDNDYLMDAYDRWHAIEMIRNQLWALRAYVSLINSYLRNADRKPILRHLGIFGDWVIRDKAMIERIIMKSKGLENW